MGLQEHEDAPNFTVPIADQENIDTFTLNAAVGNGPIVLAFIPGAFTSTCTEEVCEFRDTLDFFEELNADVYGVSVDPPPVLQRFIEEYDLNFPMLSDFDQEVIVEYGVVIEELAGLYGPVADRAIFVIDDEGKITYKWVAENPGVLPDMSEVKQAVSEAA
ncbi:MAG: redoxin domain-containing protein [Halobacteria archaeon]|nr:redoxin domain-containing protein [Halobacteria archaeon]